LDAVIVNPTSITCADRMTRFIRSVQRGPLVPYFSGGYCLAHVSDVVEGIKAALERGRTGHRYILAGENLTFRAMGEKTARAMGLSRRFIRIPPFVTGVAGIILEPWARWRHSPPKISRMTHFCVNRYRYYDSTKALQELNYQPRDFDAILQDALRP